MAMTRLPVTLVGGFLGAGKTSLLHHVISEHRGGYLAVLVENPGALNLAAGLRDAWLAHSPVIAMTGGREPKTKFRKVYQEIDDMPAFEPVTKFNATVDDVARFPDMVRQAFRTAVTGCPGPVHLQFRGNEGQSDAEEADREPLVVIRPIGPSSKKNQRLWSGPAAI